MGFKRKCLYFYSQNMLSPFPWKGLSISIAIVMFVALILELFCLNFVVMPHFIQIQNMLNKSWEDYNLGCVCCYYNIIFLLKQKQCNSMVTTHLPTWNVV